MKIAPLYFLSQLTDEQVAEHSCSDRIWLPRPEFERFARLMTEPDVFHVLELRNELGQRVVGVPFQPHMNTNNDDTIYVPPWMYAILEDAPDNIMVDRISPGPLTRMSVLPYTSDHLHCEEPEIALRDAFERYGCITMGTKIPIMLPNGTTMEVEIENTEPRQHTPLCIRAETIELELHRPLDRPATPPRSPTPIQEEQPFQIPITPPSEPQPDRETIRRQVLEAALRRLNNTSYI